MRKILDLKLDRDGDITTNNVLSLIVAVIGLGILILGIVKLYGIYSDSSEKNAQKTLDTIISKINALESGDEADVVLQGFSGAENWYLEGFSKDSSDAPDKCLFESCLCICSLSKGDVLKENYRGSSSPEKICQKNINFCRKIDLDGFKLYSVDKPNEIEGIGFKILKLLSNSIAGGASNEIRFIPYIRMNNKLLKINILKAKESNREWGVIYHLNENYKVNVK